ncbi:MAG: hypothetical protein H6737_24010 [Alphaproteobacteria bacterium]|nr:hypothetical protein [Alphaproteobacteria bacterium]MCB9746765.1 hypothetical protein [Alphaproteobacteria bacterium]
MLNVDLAKAWTPSWQAFRERAVRAWHSRVRADPQSFLAQVQQFSGALFEARQRLDRCATLLPSAPDLTARVVDLETRHALLAAGLYADARPAAAIEGLPIGIVVGGVLIGVAGIAWAIAALQYAMNLREQTALLEKELEARVEASREGRELAPSSLQPPSLQRTGWLLVGALALVTAGVAVPAFLKRSA